MFETMLGLGLLLATSTPIEPTSTEIPTYVTNYTLTDDISTLRRIELNSTTSIAEYIEARAMKYGYSPKRAVAIAKCESGLLPTAKSKTSSASGIFQFIKGTWEGTMVEMGEPVNSNRFDPHFNIEAGVYLLGKGGESHWSESKSCWSKSTNKT